MKRALSKPALRRLSGLLLVTVFFLSALPLWSQGDAPSQFARTYPYPVEAVKRALEQIGGFSGGKLPVVDGFVSSLIADSDHYERPYYQYHVQLDQGDATATTVKVEARITAWYAGADPAHSQYRSLPSNGRLENDLLDRLQDALAPSGTKPATTVPVKANPSGIITPAANSNHTDANPASPAKPAPQVKPAAPATPQEQLDAVLAQRQEVREKTATVLTKLDAQKAANGKSSETSKLASVKHSGVGVMSRKNFGGPVLFRAQVEDEFEVQSADSGWATVTLADGSTAFIQADELMLPPGLVEKSGPVAVEATAQAAKTSDPDLDFWVSREDVNVFSGDWARLKGKKVLFVYAQPRGLLSDIAGDDAKLAYAKRIFTNRLHSVDQAATRVEGVVVVFMGNRGGVAAATLTDIQQWVTGSIGDEAFVNRCSLDPPTEFRRIHLK
jgi:hypothetical protein